jgi:hypothetical protein
MIQKNERHFHFSVSGAGDYIKDEPINEFSRRPKHKKEQKAFPEVRVIIRGMNR